MTKLFSNSVNDDFASKNGALVGYSDGTWPLPLRRHYDIRSFHSNDILVPYTADDDEFWDNYRYTTYNVGDLRSVANVTSRARLMSETDTLTMSTMDTMPVGVIDIIGTSMGNEEWPTTGGIVVGKNASYRYANSISIPLSNGVLATVPSFYSDDLLTGLADVPYYIELVLRSFPAQAAAAHLNLSSSFIDFSTDTNFSAGATTSIPFSASIHDITAGGDTYFRVPRSALTIDLTAVKAIRFRLLATGGSMTFIAQNMRLVAEDYTWKPIDIDTKRNQLVRSVPRAGTPEWSTVAGDMYFYNVYPIDGEYVAMFNTGHNPTTANDNILRLYFRRQTNGDRIEIRLANRSTQSQISIVKIVNGVSTTVYQTAATSNVLTNETYYYLFCVVDGSNVSASVYQTNGLNLGSLVYTTGTRTISDLTTGGSVGYSFEPYNYDFTIQYIAPTDVQFATFEPTAMISRTPAEGATLWPNNSQPVNLIDDAVIEAWGDAEVSVSNGTIQITRDGSEYQGGIRTTPMVYVGDTTQLMLTGEIQTSQVQGIYRAALIDQWDSVAWIGEISNTTNLLPNQWTSFSVPVKPGILPGSFYLHVQQQGFYSGTFSLRDLRLDHNTISWSVSPDNGTTWQPFLRAINYEFSGAMFAAPSTSIKLQAIAHSDRAWIKGYKLYPRYLT